LADSVPDAERVAATAKRMNKKLVEGYNLRHHPSWEHFIELSTSLDS
jgi:predicted dehydrogenase